MYKSVNLSEEAYKKLKRIAVQLNRPKAQIVKLLIKEYERVRKEGEKEKLERFNKEMGTKVKALQFSKKIKVSTDDIDKDFAALSDTNYMR